MTHPTILLLLLLATSSAALGHLFWGNRWLQIPLFWFAASVGCLLPYATGLHLPLNLPMPAGVPVLESVLLAWIAIIIASRLRV